MNKENKNKLFKEFDSFFNWGKPFIDNLVTAFGFECGDGWFKLIWKLCKDLKKLEKKAIKKNPSYLLRVNQVKEKYGELRFYIEGFTNKMGMKVIKAENNSYRICETCGKPGKPRNNGWIRTLCNRCFKERYSN